MPPGAPPMAGMDMSAPAAPATPPILKAAPAAAPTPGDMPGMAKDGSAPMPGMQMSGMSGDLGAYPMTRDASGTSWQPDSSPMEGQMGRLGGWSTMVEGYATLDYDNQGGPRGGDKTFVESMFMLMAQHPLGGGTLTLRGMGSLDPLMGKSGYPLLLGTGETANGRTALVDRQHPHDAVMELAAVYSHDLAAQTSGLLSSGFVYVGWAGEPALGPVTFMHRFSGEANPEAPIDHHWLDSTHITFGVATVGLTRGPFKLEASSFTGREPNQNRWDFDHPRFDSWSTRLTYNPTADLSFQVSTGWLHSPEQLEPEVSQKRTTASGTYNLPLKTVLFGRSLSGNWQSTAAWGRDQNEPGHTLDAYLLESAATLGRHSLFGRVENADKDELFDDDPTSPNYRRIFNVSKISVGYYYTTPLSRLLALDVGGLVSKYDLPSSLTSTYGPDPTSFMLFTRVWIR